LGAEAQVSAFSFSERGRLFMTSPSVFVGSTSPDRNLAIDASEGSGKFVAPKPVFYGASISGQYFFSGLFLGYQVSAGLTPKSAQTKANTGYSYEAQDYTGEAGLYAGIVAMRWGNLSVIPSYGLGYGVWATHLFSRAITEPNLSTSREDKEGMIWTSHIVHDAAMQLTYTLPSNGGSRFAFGLRGGYKNYVNAAEAKTALGPLPGTYGPLGMQGYYAQLSLGVGVIRTNKK
jgi:hypothetical protein